jgi:hypothetical protein
MKWTTSDPSETPHPLKKINILAFSKKKLLKRIFDIFKLNKYAISLDGEQAFSFKAFKINRKLALLSTPTVFSSFRVLKSIENENQHTRKKSAIPHSDVDFGMWKTVVIRIHLPQKWNILSFIKICKFSYQKNCEISAKPKISSKKQHNLYFSSETISY